MFQMLLLANGYRNGSRPAAAGAAAGATVAAAGGGGCAAALARATAPEAARSLAPPNAASRTSKGTDMMTHQVTDAQVLTRCGWTMELSGNGSTCVNPRGSTEAGRKKAPVLVERAPGLS
jgi:hypothetical protein